MDNDITKILTVVLGLAIILLVILIKMKQLKL